VERPVANQGHIGRQLVSHGVNAGDGRLRRNGLHRWSCAAGWQAWPLPGGFFPPRVGRSSARCGQQPGAFSVTLADILFAQTIVNADGQLRTQA